MLYVRICLLIKLVTISIDSPGGFTPPQGGTNALFFLVQLLQILIISGTKASGWFLGFSAEKKLYQGDQSCDWNTRLSVLSACTSFHSRRMWKKKREELPTKGKLGNTFPCYRGTRKPASQNLWSNKGEELLRDYFYSSIHWAGSHSSLSYLNSMDRK